MEFLNRKQLLVLIMLFISFSGYTQKNNPIQAAFQDSYSFEISGKYVQAIQEIKSVYDDSSYPMNLRLGWLNYKANQYTESVRYYQAACKLMPLSVEARLGLVNSAALLGNWEQVKTAYQEILKADPGNYTANFRMGQIWYNRQDYKKAFEYFSKVANLYPFDYDGTVMYGWACLKSGKFREAKILFSNALLIKPGDPSALEGLSFIK